MTTQIQETPSGSSRRHAVKTLLPHRVIILKRRLYRFKIERMVVLLVVIQKHWAKLLDCSPRQ